MTRFFKRASAIVGLIVFVPTVSFAHAFLDHAVPGVGSTIATTPSDLELDFTQTIVVALSSVKVTGPDGATVVVAKPTSDSAKSDAIHVHVGKALPPGLYVVTWRVVSIDTHPTSGSYKFTISP